MNRRKMIGLAAIIAVIVAYYCVTRNMKDPHAENAERFLHSNIRGRMISFSNSKGVITLRVDNETEAFQFFPHKDGFAFNFKKHVHEGDSIIKPAYAETTRVKTSNGEEFSLTF